MAPSMGEKLPGTTIGQARQPASGLIKLTVDGFRERLEVGIIMQVDLAAGGVVFLAR